GLVYAWSVARRVRRQLVRAIEAGRGIGVRGRRAWVAVLVVHQQRLWPPLVAAAAVLLMVVAHLASGSRGGTAALLVGLAVAGAGIVARQASRWRWAPAALALVLVVGGGASIVGWAMADGDAQENVTTEAGDVSLAARLAVTAKGSGIVRDHPLLGTGLGSWLHAFRPYVEPPIEGGIWDHAHNDYLELVAETGVAGAVLIVAFAIAVVRMIRRRPNGSDTSRELDVPADFRRSDWARALAEALGPGRDGDEAVRRALALEPWSADVRDQLGLRMIARGETEAGAAELEESMSRFPYLASHAYLSAEVDSTSDPGRLVRALAEGDTMAIRLATLEPPTSDAMGRGLRRAVERVGAGQSRT